MDSENNKNKIFQEAYFGKSRTLIEAENMLNQIVFKLKKDPSFVVGRSPENARLQELLRKQFGFKEVQILWNNTASFLPTAQTLMGLESTFLGNISYNINADNGYYDKAHINYCVIQLSSSFVLHHDMTGGEYLAIILHEIGHNFDSSIYNMLHYVFGIIQPVKVMSTDVYGNQSIMMVPASIQTIVSRIIMRSEVGKKITSGLQKISDFILDKLPTLRKVIHSLNVIVSDIVKQISRMFSVLGLVSIPSVILFSPISHIGNITDRKMEQFADSFATIYGYSPEMITALDKIMPTGMITKTDRKHELTSFDKIMLDLSMLTTTVIDVFGTGSSHGSLDTRINSSIRLLEKELSRSNLSPSIRKEIQRQIEQLKKSYETYLSAEYGKNQLEYTSMARNLISRVFGKETDFIARLFPSYYAGTKGYSMESEIEDELVEEWITSVMESYHMDMITAEDCIEILEILK